MCVGGVILCYQANGKLAGFQSQKEESRVSIHTEEL